MASRELIQSRTECEYKIQRYGITEERINLLADIAKLAFEVEKDKAFGLETSARAKEYINQYIASIIGQGKNVWDLEKMAQDSGEVYSIVNKYYEILKAESYDLFESFVYFMERKRQQKKRFYLPRQKTMKIVVDDLQTLEDDRGRKFFGLSMPSRVGKLISDDTPVLTTKGWKRHGDIKVGDYVFGDDGKPKKVYRVFEKNIANKRVWFTDHTYIDCHENHEWLVYDRAARRERIVKTKELTKSPYKENGKIRYRFQTPICEPIKGEEKKLPVKPYTFGAWLGDGTNQKPRITICDTDLEILKSIEDDGYKCIHAYKQTGCTAYEFSELKQDLRKINLCYRSEIKEKYIPDCYICASIEQRLELLAGLLDTDGTLRKAENRYSYATTSVKLKEDVVSLISTFGWRVCAVKYEPRTSSSGIKGNKDVWVISFNPTMEIPCRVERKKLNTFSKQKRISVERVEDIEPKQGNCISVEGGIYRVGKRCIPTHNSTICIFFLAWIALKRPNSHSAMGGHSGVLAKGFYKELINIITTEEYTFKELYDYFHPEYADKPFPTDKSADEFTITLGDPDRFATITCRGIDGTWTGAIDVSADGYLYVDDLVRDRQHSLSPQRMEDTFQEYLNKMVDRKIGGAKELIVGTLWNVLDPLQRISIQYERDERYAFRRIPALNENDESNFDYEVNGFSTEYYRDMRERLANAEWMAKYQQSPYVREGLLFPQEELKYSDGLIDDGTWIVTALCDPAFGGADSLSMPVKLEHKESGKKTIIDWVFKKGTQNITIPLVVDAIIRNDITELKIEKNSGGGLYADNLKKELEKRGYNHCKITTFSASTKMDKMERIKAYSDYVKDNYYFLMESRYVPTAQEDEINGIKRFRRNEMYNNAMNELHMITSEGKNPHDDSADAITLMALNDEKPINRVEAIANPFRTGGYGYYGY